MRDDRRSLTALASAYGVQASFRDSFGRRRVASRESLMATLRALGADVEQPSDAAAALRERNRQQWQRPLPPVGVVWDGRRTAVALRLPAATLSSRAVCRVTLEDGHTVERSFRPRGLRVVAEENSGRRRYVELRLELPGPWPLGYHRLQVEAGERIAETRIISAPRRAYGVAPSNAEPLWGVFLPLYALHSDRSWGAGDFADLAGLAGWTAVQGGQVVATLPLLASFLDRPFEPSPYRPVSRLFWNELYLALDRIPELERSSQARTLIRSSSMRRQLRKVRTSAEVDYREAMAAKRRVLQLLARGFFSRDGSRREEFQRFVRNRPEVEDYARFRATVERRGSSWPTWPARLRDGRLHRGDFEQETARYHAYVQWLAAEQLGAAARFPGAPKLCLDLPLGVHPEGYDVWREREAFAREASAGAPPDAFFSRGQNWSFPPLHPDRSRDQGHRYLRACLRHHLETAGMLRVDHVMSLHRLYWIPRGVEPTHGVYVRYPAEELYALLCLESQRQRCLVVGEDLGTVPSYVGPAMQRHNLRRTYVLQSSVGPGRPLASPNAIAIAGLNTHDMPTFASFWRGSDIRQRVKLGLLDRAEGRLERERRRELRESLLGTLRRGGWLAGAPATAANALRACLSFLADSRAETLLVNLEDLWLETRAQNIPGTGAEQPNWRGKARYSLGAFSKTPRVLRTLRELDRLRREGHEESG